MPDRSKSYHIKLMSDLKNVAEARAYITAALADDDEIFLSAVKDVAEANSEKAGKP